MELLIINDYFNMPRCLFDEVKEHVSIHLETKNGLDTPPEISDKFIQLILAHDDFTHITGSILGYEEFDTENRVALWKQLDNIDYENEIKA